MRPLTIRSRYEEAECVECGAAITLDFGPEGYDGDPIEVTKPSDHNDDCPTATAKQAELEEQTPAQMFAALAVLVRTKATHDWLAENDPMALQQAKAAMIAYGDTYGSERCGTEWVSNRGRRVICEDTEGAIRDRLLGRSR